MSTEIVPNLPSGIDPAKIEPGALLLTEPTPGKPRMLVEVLEWRFDVQTMAVLEENKFGTEHKTLTCGQVRQAQLLRRAPNVIDDVLSGNRPAVLPKHQKLFDACDEKLARARAERHAKRQPRTVRNPGEARRGYV